MKNAIENSKIIEKRKEVTVEIQDIRIYYMSMSSGGENDTLGNHRFRVRIIADGTCLSVNGKRLHQYAKEEMNMTVIVYMRWRG